MEYREFVEEVQKGLEESMGKEYLVEVHQVKKNNGVVLDGMVIRKECEMVSPNIYLNSYYEQYLEGQSIEEIERSILYTYQEAICLEQADFELNLSLEAMESKIIFRLVNYEFNKELLKELPHIRFLDLAVTFHCLIKQDEDGIGTIRITKEQMKNWELSTRELMRLAYENTKSLFPPKIRTMEEVIMEIIGKEQGRERRDQTVEDSGEYEGLLNEIQYSMENSNRPSMYVLTNQTGINGATVILYRELLAGFANKIDSDFYILPSSIHEVILVPATDCIHREDLVEMVKDVNHTQVAHQEILSNQVYYFDRKQEAFHL